MQARRNYLRCISVHKCLHRLVPSYLLSEFRHTHFFHGHNTRSHDLLCPPSEKTVKYQGSFRINGTQTFNTLSRNIRVVEMFSKFKIKLKCHACGTCCLYNLIICLLFNVFVFVLCQGSI